MTAIDKPAPSRGPVQPPPGSGRFHRDWDFIRRVLIVLALIGLAYFVWLISSILLLIFAAILIAVLLNAFAEFIASHTPVSERWALPLAVIVITLLLAGFLFMFGSQISGQISQVFEKLPDAINAVGKRVGLDGASEQLEEAISSGAGLSTLSRAAGLGYTVIGAVTDLVLVIVAAIYLAADPRLYRRGTVKLLPPSQHERIIDAMNVTGNALRLWFSGQLVTMALIATVSTLAFWWIGLPSPLALGAIAGITNFVPFIGPILGTVPAMVFALAMDMNTVLWTIGAVVVIQQIEGNIITPFVQKRAVSMPPVLALFAILVFGVIFGLPGVFLAVPLTVAIFVLVKKLWVRQTLGEETEVPGEDDNSQDETDKV